MCRSKAAGGRRCPGHRPVAHPGLFALSEQPGSVLVDRGAPPAIDRDRTRARTEHPGVPGRSEASPDGHRTLRGNRPR